MNACDDYDARAVRYRPADPTQLAAEVRRLAAQGLRPRDVSMALRLGMDSVLEALREPENAFCPRCE